MRQQEARSHLSCLASVKGTVASCLLLVTGQERGPGHGIETRQQVTRSWPWILGKSTDLAELQFLPLDKLGLDQMVSRASIAQGRKLSKSQELPLPSD